MPRDSAVKPFSRRRARLASATSEGSRKTKRKTPQSSAIRIASATTAPIAVISDVSMR